MHAFIRGVIAAKYGNEVADNCSILYGGSCKASNAKALFAKPDVDGGLIGYIADLKSKNAGRLCIKVRPAFLIVISIRVS